MSLAVLAKVISNPETEGMIIYLISLIPVFALQRMRHRGITRERIHRPEGRPDLWCMTKLVGFYRQQKQSALESKQPPRRSVIPTLSPQSLCGTAAHQRDFYIVNSVIASRSSDIPVEKDSRSLFLEEGNFPVSEVLWQYPCWWQAPWSTV